MSRWTRINKVVGNRYHSLVDVTPSLKTHFADQFLPQKICPICEKLFDSKNHCPKIFCSNKCNRRGFEVFRQLICNSELVKSNIVRESAMVAQSRYGTKKGLTYVDVISCVNRVLEAQEPLDLYEREDCNLVNEVLRDYRSGVLKTQSFCVREIANWISIEASQLEPEREFSKRYEKRQVRVIDKSDGYELQTIEEFLSTQIATFSTKSLLNRVPVIDLVTAWYFGAPRSLRLILMDRQYHSFSELRSTCSSSGVSESEVNENLEFIDQLEMAWSVVSCWPSFVLFSEPWTAPQKDLITKSSRTRQFLVNSLMTLISVSREKDFTSGFGKSIRRFCVVELRFSEFTLEAIGQLLGISRERVRQIAVTHVEVIDRVYALDAMEIEKKNVLNSRKDDQLKMVLVEKIRSCPGLTPAELEPAFKNNEGVRQWFYREFGHLVLEPDRPGVEQENRKDILDSLKAASQYAWPLTGVAYDQLLAGGFVSGVSRNRVMQVFGSWREACELAGVEAGESLFDYNREFSYIDCLKYYAEFLLDPEFKGLSKYNEWRALHQTPDKVPSVGTLRNRIHRSGLEIRYITLSHLRKQWDSSWTD